MNPILFLSLFALVALLLTEVRRVPAQRAATLRRLGRYRRTLGEGWHWALPGIDRAGPEKAGETLERVDAWLAAQTRDALSQADHSAEQLKRELNRRIGHLGLRIVRCSLHGA